MSKVANIEFGFDAKTDPTHNAYRIIPISRLDVVKFNQLTEILRCNWGVRREAVRKVAKPSEKAKRIHVGTVY